jgi:hypothetical protein
MFRRPGPPRHLVGRRGTALLTYAALDITVGLRLATARPDAAAFYAWLDGPAPLWAWSVPWLAVAAVCTVGAFGGRDKAAFTSAIGIKVLWCSLYLSGWALGEVPDGWVNGAVWAAFGMVVWLVAGWPEPVNGEGRPAWTPPVE